MTEPNERLAALTWPEAARRPDAILAVPLGATEQHGPHLPLSTDTDIAVALCDALAASRDNVLVAPPLPTVRAANTPDSPGRCPSARTR